METNQVSLIFLFIPLSDSTANGCFEGFYVSNKKMITAVFHGGVFF